MRPVILLDCDGPMADFTQAYLEALRLETGASHAVGDVDRWDIHESPFFVELARVHGADLRRRVETRIMQPGFCDGIAVVPGAQEMVGKLSELGDVYVVTSPWDSSPTWMHERLHWVAKHFPTIGKRRVIQTAQKHLVRGDVFVDDKPSHIEDWSKAWPAGTPILFDMHHNRAEPVAFGVRGGWNDVLAAVEDVEMELRLFGRAGLHELRERSAST